MHCQWRLTAPKDIATEPTSWQCCSASATAVASLMARRSGNCTSPPHLQRSRCALVGLWASGVPVLREMERKRRV